MFLRIQLSFIHETHALSSFFTICHLKNRVYFYDFQFSRISLNISLWNFVPVTQILQASVKIDLPNYFSLWTFWWLTFFDSLSLVQPIRLFKPFQQGFWLTYCSVLYESIEHADDTVVRFEIMFVLKFESTAWEFFTIKQINGPWLCSIPF